MNWQPIISDLQVKRKIDNKIDQIASCLEKDFYKEDKLSLVDGKAGLLLFFCYYSLYKNKDFYSEKFNWFLSELERDLAKNESYDFSYASGYSGIFWLINFLRQDFIDFEDTPNDIINSVVLATNKKLEKKEYDFLHGTLGGIFFLNEIKSKAEVCSYFTKINDLGTENENYFYFTQDYFNSDEKQICNLSLSHGLASFIIVLSIIYENHPEQKLKQLISKSTNFLLSAKNPPSFKSIFPSWIGVNNNRIPATSRLSWCYGDLGNAIALMKAAKVLGNEYIYNTSLDVFKFNAQRRTEDQEIYIYDAEFCHGTSGLAHIYNRVYHLTLDPTFKETANYWYLKTLEYATFENSTAGYKKLKHTGEMLDDPYFLEGIAGIGLSLISSVSELEPKWDRCLLIS